MNFHTTTERIKLPFNRSKLLRTANKSKKVVIKTLSRSSVESNDGKLRTLSLVERVLIAARCETTPLKTAKEIQHNLTFYRANVASRPIPGTIRRLCYIRTMLRLLRTVSASGRVEGGSAGEDRLEIEGRVASGNFRELPFSD